MTPHTAHPVGLRSQQLHHSDTWTGQQWSLLSHLKGCVLTRAPACRRGAADGNHTENARRGRPRSYEAPSRPSHRDREQTGRCPGLGAGMASVQWGGASSWEGEGALPCTDGDGPTLCEGVRAPAVHSKRLTLHCVALAAAAGGRVQSGKGRF